VHAALALREDGYETIMVNCNPETVSTDYDISDRLYFEPLTLEDVLEIVDKAKPTGVIVQFGGQTPLKLAGGLAKAGVPIIGTSPDMIDRAEDRARFQQMLNDLGLKQPPNRAARTLAEALAALQEIGLPVVVRPSNVLGGRAMEIIHAQADLGAICAMRWRCPRHSPSACRFFDRFLNDAIEVDVDAVSDGKDVLIGGIMEASRRPGCTLWRFGVLFATSACRRKSKICCARSSSDGQGVKRRGPDETCNSRFRIVIRGKQSTCWSECALRAPSLSFPRLRAWHWLKSRPAAWRGSRLRSRALHGKLSRPIIL
jgi:biotin carboxylase